MSECVHFSPREKEILNLLLEGLPDKEIADRSGIAHHTVRLHMVSIRQKLKVESRTQVVIKFMRNHKGEQCFLIPPLTCQEGYCNGCQIYLDHGHQTVESLAVS